MIEKDLERLLVNEMKKMGGKAYKFTPHENGMPDRLILRPFGDASFVEMKKPGEKPRPLQLKRIRDLRAMGFRVDVLDSRESVLAYVWEGYND